MACHHSNKAEQSQSKVSNFHIGEPFNTIISRIRPAMTFLNPQIDSKYYGIYFDRRINISALWLWNGRRDSSWGSGLRKPLRCVTELFSHLKNVRVKWMVVGAEVSVQGRQVHEGKLASLGFLNPRAQRKKYQLSILANAYLRHIAGHFSQASWFSSLPLSFNLPPTVMIALPYHSSRRMGGCPRGSLTKQLQRPKQM